MQTKEINDIKIKPVVHLALESHEIVGYDYFSTLYSNIYICSQPKSGQTTIIYNILKNVLISIQMLFSFVLLYTATQHIIV